MGHFLPFTLPPKNQKNQNFEKNEKTNKKKKCWRYRVRQAE